MFHICRCTASLLLAESPVYSRSNKPMHCQSSPIWTVYEPMSLTVFRNRILWVHSCLANLLMTPKVIKRKWFDSYLCCRFGGNAPNSRNTSARAQFVWHKSSPASWIPVRLLEHVYKAIRIVALIAAICADSCSLVTQVTLSGYWEGSKQSLWQQQSFSSWFSCMWTSFQSWPQFPCSNFHG